MYAHNFCTNPKPIPARLEYTLQHPACPRIYSLENIAENYDALLCDVWGVLHNGVSANSGAVQALSSFKNTGKPTFLLTNAPRPNAEVSKQLARLNIPLDTTFDEIITSGDVTRQIIKTLAQPIFHIGSEFDKSIFKGLNVKLVDWPQARSIVCTGLYEDFTETPEDYEELLTNLKSRDLPFICANPDIVAEHGGIMRWCAGALAQNYSKLGGKITIVGKPNPPIYEHAHALLNKAANEQLGKSRILAIGDGINTDIAGAIGYGLDVLYISNGIHAAQYSKQLSKLKSGQIQNLADVKNPDNIDEEKLQEFLKDNNLIPIAWMPDLQ